MACIGPLPISQVNNSTVKMNGPWNISHLFLQFKTSKIDSFTGTTVLNMTNLNVPFNSKILSQKNSKLNFVLDHFIY